MQAGNLEGRSVFRSAWPFDDAFVLRGIAGGTPAVSTDESSFLEVGDPDDLLVAEATLSHPRLDLVRSNGRYALFRLR
jgi:hypothetical protein